MEFIFALVVTGLLFSHYLTYVFGYCAGIEEGAFREKHKGSGMIDSAGLPL